MPRRRSSSAEPTSPLSMDSRTSRQSVGENWWSRPCGGRAVLTLALPLVASTLSWTIMNFIDRMFLLWYSTESMAAAMPAGLLHFTVICFPLGVVSYVNTFVAQYQGAKQENRIGLIVWQGVILSLASIPLVLATIPLAPIVFGFADHGPGIVRLETTYYQVLAFGGGAMIAAGALSSFFTGRGVTHVTMLVDSGSALLNVILDYLLIFGHWGFPELGIVGAGWATVISQWSRPLAYWVLMTRPRHRHRFGIVSGRRLDMPLLRRLCRFGGANGLQMLVEMVAISLFLLLIGRLGELSLAATTLAFNVNSLAFMPLLGLGLALSTLVGQELGRDRPELAQRATWTAVTFACVYSGTLGLFYFLTPNLFLFGHVAGTDPGQFESLRSTTVILLRFVAAYCLLDALLVTFVSTLKGAGDTRFILVVSAIMSPLPVLVGGLGMYFLNWGLLACWTVITVWIWSLAGIYLLRFLSGHWKEMRVIEPDAA